MQVLRLLAPRRGAATTITAPVAPEPADSSDAVDAEEYDDEGSFFELDLSVRASSSSAGSASSGSSDDSDDASLMDLDFVISLHRSRSASPSFHFPAPPLPLLKPGSGGLRTLSFAGSTASTRNAALYGGRRSSFARSSAGSARSLRLFMESPASPADADEDPEPQPRRAPSRDVIRRYLTKISTRLRRSVRPRRGGEGRLRKSRSASAAVTTTTTTTAPAAAPPRRDDSLAEKQDGIASAIAHCKESLHRASLSLSLPDCGSPLPRSRSDPGNCQAP
jgi:hypothetical protein